MRKKICVTKEEFFYRLNSTEFVITALFDTLTMLSVILVVLLTALNILSLLKALSAILLLTIFGIILADDLKRIDKELGIKWDE